ncbi:MAG: transposase [Chloroflexi bacterium]|nr:transposase [Chloroflexota bacterium]
MGRGLYRPEEIINKLRKAEFLLSHGCGVGQASRKIGVSEQTYYRWQRQYGGVRVEQARRLSELERENIRLKKLLGDLSLSNGVCEKVVNATP